MEKRAPTGPVAGNPVVTTTTGGGSLAALLTGLAFTAWPDADKAVLVSACTVVGAILNSVLGLVTQKGFTLPRKWVESVADPAVFEGIADRLREAEATSAPAPWRPEYGGFEGWEGELREPVAAPLVDAPTAEAAAVFDWAEPAMQATVEQEATRAVTDEISLHDQIEALRADMEAAFRHVAREIKKLAPKD